MFGSKTSILLDSISGLNRTHSHWSLFSELKRLEVGTVEFYKDLNPLLINSFIYFLPIVLFVNYV